ncbi:MAG: phosphodiester glycosidase family protein, partial [Balneolaceae bacterium]
DSFKPWITRGTSFSGQVTGDGFTAPINNINGARGANEIVAYNSFYGSSTGTNEFGTEVALQLQGEVKVNQPAQYVVTRIEENVGNMSLGSDDLILAAHGSATSNFEGLNVDDEISIQINLNPFENAIIEAVGGNGQFLKDGEVIETWAEWHPRTAAGFSADTTKLYFMVVDGRQSASRGMTTGQMGIFMQSIGAANAVNLDGGGSSTMLVQDEVMNNPSDGNGERSVANALFVTLPYSADGEIERVRLRTNKTKVFLTKTTQLKVLGFDADHRFSQIPTEEVEFTVDEELGSISSGGVFTGSMNAGTGYIYMNYNEFADSTLITVLDAGSINLSPSNVALDTTMTFTPVYTVYDELGYEQTVTRNNIDWSVTNPGLGNIDDEGNYTPIAAGTNGIVGSYSNVSDTTWAEVQEIAGYIIIDDFSNIENWTFTTENLHVDSVSIHSLDEDALEVRFSYPPSNSEPHIHLQKNNAIDGVPSFSNVVYSTDGNNYVMTVDIETNSDGRFRMNPERHANSTEPEVMHFTFEKDKVTGINSSNFYFPFTYEAISLRLPKNTTDEAAEGYFRVYELGVSYSETPVSIDDEKERETPEKIELSQNYPNPFNPTTQISFSLPAAENVSLNVFDVLGRKVATLVESRLGAGNHTYRFDAENLSSGIYLYQLKTGKSTLSRKMMLIK